jgi:hypothetical protein
MYWQTLHLLNSRSQIHLPSPVDMQCSQIYFDLSLTHAVPHSYDLLMLLNILATVYSAVALPRSAVPLTSKAAQFRVPAPQHCQHYNNFQFTPNIPPLLFITYCLYRNMKVPLRSFYVNCRSWRTEHTLYPLCSAAPSD